tara:strand:+ start:858 stop:1472 length:615 start_codon:yes stop_codon:yes gene_type:complete
MNLKEAKEITGGLSQPNKMPGYAYNIPAWHCITGSKLVDIENSVCAGCYALKNRYIMPIQAAAMERRFKSLTHPQWVDAMVVLVTHYSKKVPFFRWHDSGDLQGVDHLMNIFEVCIRTPQIQHWMPTREVKILKGIQPESVPKNLIIRVSSHMINQGPVKSWPWTSTVIDKGYHTCPAATQGNECRDCRQCWNRDYSNVSYGKH